MYSDYLYVHGYGDNLGYANNLFNNQDSVMAYSIPNSLGGYGGSNFSTSVKSVGNKKVNARLGGNEFNINQISSNQFNIAFSSKMDKYSFRACNHFINI